MLTIQSLNFHCLYLPLLMKDVLACCKIGDWFIYFLLCLCSTFSSWHNSDEKNLLSFFVSYFYLGLWYFFIRFGKLSPTIYWNIFFPVTALSPLSGTPVKFILHCLQVPDALFISPHLFSFFVPFQVVSIPMCPSKFKFSSVVSICYSSQTVNKFKYYIFYV